MEAWMNQSWWLYDLTVLSILILCIWGGWRRGLLRTVAGLVGYVLAAFLSSILAEPAAEWVYERWAKESCCAVLEQQLAQYDLAGTVQQALASYGISLDQTQLQQILDAPDEAADQLCTVAAQQTGIPADLIQQQLHQTLDEAAIASYTGLPSWMTESLLPSEEDTTETENRLAQTVAVLLSGDNASAAETLTELYVRPVLLSMIKIFTFSALFLLISVALQAIIKGISYLIRSKGLHLGDQFLGAGIGCLQAAGFLFLMGKLTHWLVENSDGQVPFFQTALIEKTVLFQVIYRLLS